MICRVGKLGDRPKWSMISGKRWGATGTKLEFPRLVFSLRLLFLFLFLFSSRPFVSLFSTASS